MTYPFRLACVLCYFLSVLLHYKGLYHQAVQKDIHVQKGK